MIPNWTGEAIVVAVPHGFYQLSELERTDWWEMRGARILFEFVDEEPGCFQDLFCRRGARKPTDSSVWMNGLEVVCKGIAAIQKVLKGKLRYSPLILRTEVFIV